jgi:hypothetical protein
MRLGQLVEMTIRFGRVDQNVSDSLLDKLKQGKEIGKVDGYSIVQVALDQGFIGLGLVKGAPIAGVIYKEADPIELYLVYSSEQGQGHASRLLWFLKDSLKKQVIDYGAMSDDGLKFMAALAKTKRFKLSWYNLKTHKQEPFDQEQEKMAYDKKTDWRVLIESAEASLLDPLSMIILFEAPAP